MKPRDENLLHNRAAGLEQPGTRSQGRVGGEMITGSDLLCQKEREMKNQ